ncbi:MAG: transposase [Bacteroidota bacterium]
MQTEEIPTIQTYVKLPWVNTAIGNAKKVFHDTFHHVKTVYLQNYLDKFCYKLNRKYFKK